MERGPLRIYLTGNICIEAGERLVRERELPARQGRVAFAYLACHRAAAVTRDALAEAIWSDAPPAAWDAALSAIVSKLRKLLSALRSEPEVSILQQAGCYQLHLPNETWVDVEAAGVAVHEAESALRLQDFRRAWGPAVQATGILRRPFLLGEDGEWAAAQRERLRQLLVRSLECLSETSLHNEESTLAAQYATQTVDLEPLRETAYRRLMHAQAALGNRAEALKTYDRCRRLLAEELGVDPSPETEALYLSLLGAPPVTSP